MKFIRVWNE